jgi:hypothetical protein
MKDQGSHYIAHWDSHQTGNMLQHLTCGKHLSGHLLHFKWSHNTRLKIHIFGFSMSIAHHRTVITPVFEPSRRISSSCVLFKGWCPNLTESVALLDMDMISQATGTAPLLSSDGSIWFRGREILMIPRGFRDPKSCLIDLPFPSTSPSAPRGRSPRDRFANLDSRSGFTLPAAKDGRQTLICDEKGLPVIIDISGVV